ncbi:diacylglycerol/lipid kinase family protein [Haloimpatiens sp. FM7315]|uniref:diacylglycerol/lipid kinase family protein n=1 Tax=Haloimpatiens sp. FM7315 TaxID=3298609 RepID=UPI00397753C6
MTKHLFILNPSAGKGDALKYIPLIENYFNDLDHEFEIKITEYKGQATELAKDFSKKGFHRIYAVGGDGTVNEVLNGLIGSSSILGIIPCGTGNDFIKNITSSKKDILKNTIQGTIKEIDIGKINKNYYINISSIGLDSEVTYNARLFKGKKYIPSKLAYILSLLYTPFKFKPLKLDITIDDTNFSQESLLLTSSNGKCYGGGIYITPEADIFDGYLDICSIKKANFFRLMKYIPRALGGKLDGIPEVSYYKAKKVTVNSNKEFTVNIDGEILKSNSVNFEILPKALKILMPKIEQIS